MSEDSARNKQLTLRLEPALRKLAKHPEFSLAYLARRYDVPKEDLVEWLATYNGGSKDLSDARIDKVKAELGSVSTQAAPRIPTPAKPVAPQVQPPAVVSRAPEDIPAQKLVQPTSNIGAWLAEQRIKTVGVANTFIVEVTPRLASTWLKLNTGNRKPSKAKIRRFAKAMASGKWVINGETIKFSVTGRLLDGQSRLMACVLAGVPVLFEIRGGLPDVAQKTMDCGELRRNAQTLEMIGENNPNELARVLKLCWLLEQDRLSGNKFHESNVLENLDVPAVLERHPKARESVGWAVKHTSLLATLMTRSEAAFFHYAFGCSDPELAAPFCEALVEGVGLTKDSPVWHLRNYLIEARRPGGIKTTARERYAHIIKAWNAVTLGQKLDRLTWKDSEAFPAIAGWAGRRAAA